MTFTAAILLQLMGCDAFHKAFRKTADWVVDLGPEGGAGGGRVVAFGTPEEVAASPASFTGRYLRPLLQGGAGGDRLGAARAGAAG